MSLCSVAPCARLPPTRRAVRHPVPGGQELAGAAELDWGSLWTVAPSLVTPGQLEGQGLELP